MIKVIYALPDEQLTIELPFMTNEMVEQAIMRSNIIDKIPAINLTINKVGIWGQTVSLNHLVQDNDRIEIYRPLVADPNVIRQQRLQNHKTIKHK